MITIPFKVGIIGFESHNSIAPIFFRTINGLKPDGTKSAGGPMRFRGEPIVGTIFSIKAIFDHMIGNTRKEDSMKWKRPFSLKDAIYEKPDLDLLIVCQSYLFLKNNLKNMTVVYRHHDLFSPVSLRNPDILAMKNFEMKYLIRSYFPWEYRQIRRKLYSPPFIDPSIYNPDVKKEHRFVNIGPPTETFDITIRDYIWNNMVSHDQKFRDAFETLQLGHYYEDTVVPRRIYKDLLEKSDFIMCTNNWGTYIGRRHVEALAASCIPVCFVENDRAERILKRNGFIDGGTCFYFRDVQQLKEVSHYIHKSISDEEIKDMKQAGWELLQRQHLPEHRVRDILNEVDWIL